MLETPDLSWFDLRKYDGLAELDLIGWQRQIEIRSFLLFALGQLDIDPRYGKYIKLWLDDIKIMPVLSLYQANENTHYVTKPKGQSSLHTTTAWEFWMEAGDKGDDDQFSEVWSFCRMENCNTTDDKQRKIINTPMSELYKNISIDCCGHEHITLDLTATDEQLINDFKVWLSEQRAATKEQPTKNNLTDKCMKSWVKNRLLPYIDLVIINGFEKLGLTQVTIANLIHSDDVNVDVVDKTKRTTRPKAMQLFTETINEQLMMQINCMAIKD